MLTMQYWNSYEICIKYAPTRHATAKQNHSFANMPNLVEAIAQSTAKGFAFLPFNTNFETPTFKVIRGDIILTKVRSKCGRKVEKSLVPHVARGLQRGISRQPECRRKLLRRCASCIVLSAQVVLNSCTLVTHWS